MNSTEQPNKRDFLEEKIKVVDEIYVMHPHQDSYYLNFFRDPLPTTTMIPHRGNHNCTDAMHLF